MELAAGMTTAVRSGADSLQFNDDAVRQLMMVAPPPPPQLHEDAAADASSSSFTALLELPATQAMELLHLSDSGRSPATVSDLVEPPLALAPFGRTLTFPSNTVLMERAARFSVAATEQQNTSQQTTSSAPSDSSGNLVSKVKTEPAETTVAAENRNSRPVKRKEREKKVKSSVKKSKSSEDAEKLPYVHVRARRGQATDSHSLAERARREKINARMKLLQELVPGCNKIQGTALVLDEIINHVQSLQRQVELLSMRLAAVNPRVDFNLDSILAAESGSVMDSSFSGTVMPMAWPEICVNQAPCQPQWPFDAFHQPVWGREDDHHNLISSDNSLPTTLHSSQVKMEL